MLTISITQLLTLKQCILLQNAGQGMQFLAEFETESQGFITYKKDAGT